MKRSILKRSILLTPVFMVLISIAAFAGKPADTSNSTNFTLQDATKRLSNRGETFFREEDWLVYQNENANLSYWFHSIHGTQNGQKLDFDYDYSKPTSEQESDEIEQYVSIGDGLVWIWKGFTGEIVLYMYEDSKTNGYKYAQLTVLPNESSPSTETPTQETPVAVAPVQDSPSVNVMSSMPKPNLKSLKNIKKGKVTVKWKKFSKKQKKKFKMIEIECVRSDGVKSTKYVSKNKTSIVLKGLVKGSTYRIRIRTVNGKNVSNWSKTKKIKIKK